LKREKAIASRTALAAYKRDELSYGL